MPEPTVPFTLPPEGELFTTQIITRCKSLIEAGVWQGLESLKIDAWMNNFSTAEQRYFGACVLDAMIYRSEKQTVAMMGELFMTVIPHRVRAIDSSVAAHEWLGCLQDRDIDHGIRIVPVIKDDDPPTKSGPVLARLYRRALKFAEEWMIWPWQIEKARAQGAKFFIFIDDFLGTGNQFDEFATRFSLVSELNDSVAIYAPFVAHDEGLKLLAKRYPSIAIASAEKLTNSHALFSPEAPWFNDGINNSETAKQFYVELTEKSLPSLTAFDQLGHGGLELAYAFEHASPDNSLPILWKTTSNWKALVAR